MNKLKSLPITTEHIEKIENHVKSLQSSYNVPKYCFSKKVVALNDSIVEKVGINKRIVLLWAQKYCNRSGLKLLMIFKCFWGLWDSKEGDFRCGQKLGYRVLPTEAENLEYAAETWTNSALTRHICQYAAVVVYQRLATILENILSKSSIKPFHVRYYYGRRAPDFDNKMHIVFFVYK